MKTSAVRSAVAAIVVALAVVSSRAADPPAKDEAKVRDTFAAFQKALKEKDDAKIWKLLSKNSQAAAERTARVIAEKYATAGSEDKAGLLTSLGLKAAQMEVLNGQVFLKSKRFLGKYLGVPGSKIDKVAFDDDDAWVHYIEADGDKQKLRLTRFKDQWRVMALMPPPLPSGQ
jgi:hypothetical protein